MKEDPVRSAEAIWIAEPDLNDEAAKEEKLTIQMHPANDPVISAAVFEIDEAHKFVPAGEQRNNLELAETKKMIQNKFSIPGRQADRRNLA